MRQLTAEQQGQAAADALPATTEELGADWRQVGNAYEHERAFECLIDHPSVFPKARALFGGHLILQGRSALPPSASVTSKPPCSCWHRGDCVTTDREVYMHAMQCYSWLTKVPPGYAKETGAGSESSLSAFLCSYRVRYLDLASSIDAIVHQPLTC